MRALFLTSAAMGWTTYAGSVAEATAGREAVHAVHAAYDVRGLLRATTVPLPGPWSWADRNVRRVATARRALGAWSKAVGLDAFDVVHVAPPQYALGLLPGLRTAGTALTVGLDATVHQAKGELGGASPGEVSRRFGPLVRAEQAVADRATRVLAMSRWAAEGAATAYGIPPERLVVVPPGLPLLPEVAAHGGTGPVRLAFVGNGWRRKGGDRLLRWHQERWADRVELHVVSGDGAVPAGARSVVDHGRLPNDEVRRAVLPAMDLFVLPTQKDMSPWAVVEAAAAGLPVVSSALGGLDELVVDGVTGRLLPPGDDAAFVAAVEALVADPGARARMGAAARRHAEERLGASAAVRLVDEVLAAAGAR